MNIRERIRGLRQSAIASKVWRHQAISDTAGRNATRRGERGFSIMEMLTAVAIAAVLSGIAVPNLVKFTTQYQLSAGANQLAFDIARARMKAVGENISYRVSFGGSAGQTYWLEKSTDGSYYTMDGVVTYLPTSVRLGTLSEVLPAFNRSGLATGNSTISLVNDIGQQKLITVNSIGRVVVQ